MIFSSFLYLVFLKFKTEIIREKDKKVREKKERDKGGKRWKKKRREKRAKFYKDKCINVNMYVD